jgi:hypothetical protein
VAGFYPVAAAYDDNDNDYGYDDEGWLDKDWGRGVF